jgi:large subunit ribosomal protein L6e
MATIRKEQDLEAYLASTFSLKNNERPHEMVF